MPTDKPKSKDIVTINSFKEIVVIDSFNVEFDQSMTWVEVCSIRRESKEIGKLLMICQGEEANPSTIVSAKSEIDKLIEALQKAKEKL